MISLFASVLLGLDRQSLAPGLHDDSRFEGVWECDWISDFPIDALPRQRYTVHKGRWSMPGADVHDFKMMRTPAQPWPRFEMSYRLENGVSMSLHRRQGIYRIEGDTLWMAQGWRGLPRDFRPSSEVIVE